MSETLYSPLALQILLHFYGCRGHFEGIEHGPQQEAVRRFIDAGAMELASDAPHDYRVTPLGSAWVRRLLSVPCPRAVFVDEHGRIIPEQ